MEKSLEDKLYQAVLLEDQHTISQLLAEGANPNKTSSHGKTCLGEAANIGNIDIVKLLIDATKSASYTKAAPVSRKRPFKTHKRKLKATENCDETVVKCKNMNERAMKDGCFGDKLPGSTTSEKNQGYFVFNHSEGSSSDEGRITTIKSPLSPLTPSPQADLEWDEDIGNIAVAPTTSEDETWSSIYKWYAVILECTGAAIASASLVTCGIDQQDAFMKSALHYAAEHGHSGVAKLLIEAGCKLDIHTAGEGITPLHIAVAKNHTEIVNMLITAGSNVNYKTHEKMTSLHFAASRGHLDVVKILVSNGVHLEARDTSNRTALYLAAGRGHVKVVQYLIAAGANVNGENINGYTPLCEAVWQRNAQVVEILLKNGARIIHSHRLLHNAIFQRQVEIVEILANANVGINLHDDMGDTPLLLATRLSEIAVVRLLLEKGAHVNATNSITGANALHIAVESVDCPNEFEELLITLLEYNIDMNAIALPGDTPLNRALLLLRDHAAIYLIRYGADVNGGDLHSYGLDNLSIASRKLSCNLAVMLLKAGHHYSIPDHTLPIPKPGSTANWLYYACKRPLNLRDLCRIKIRAMTKNRVLYKYINSLPIPKNLKRFLMLEDEGW